MKIAIVGAGPAGLYFAYLMKKADPAHDILVLEQNQKGATYGFGVVFSDAALTHLEDADDAFYAALDARAEHWDDLTIVHRGERVPIDGNGFSGISRLALLEILQDLCAEAGVEVCHGETIEDLERFDDCDLVVGADGVNSTVRRLLDARFQPQVSELTNRFIWYGTGKVFPTLSLTFRSHDTGSYVAHHYRYAPDKSTFIVECDAETFERGGFEQMEPEASRRLCEEIFASDLEGHPLISNTSIWRRFPVLTNANWRAGNTVLIGDALRSIHFSIGSGTRLAMEDAIALFQAFQKQPGKVSDALDLFIEGRKPQVEKLLSGARGSYEWYEEFASRLALDPMALAYDYMTRSGRVSEERLAKIAPRFTNAWRAQRSSAPPVLR
ncbi:MAG: NAD(P)-binding protein [Alphaproteobacteria bacterium]|nr:NAD(P)-binding protein [Alphaproteobacteria bacterium]